MHGDDLGGMPNRNSVIGAAQTCTFFLERSFITDENNCDVRLSRRLEGTLDTRNRTVISSHCIKRDLHARRCAHGWYVTTQLYKYRSRASVEGDRSVAHWETLHNGW